MPTRMLREGFVTSERIGALSDDAFRFYFSLFAVVDDYGCIEWSTAVLRGSLYPHVEPPLPTVKLRELLDKCMKGPRPLIILYEVNGKEYIQIQEFGQRLQSKPKCPLPPDSRESTVSHGEKPLRASRARSESESESESKSKAGAESKPVAPPPRPALADDDFGGHDLVTETTATLIRQHTAGGWEVREPKLVRRAVEIRLGSAVQPAAVAASIIAAHARVIPIWQADVRENPRSHKPKQLHYWIQDQGDLGVPMAPAKAISAPQPFRKADLPR